MTKAPRTRATLVSEISGKLPRLQGRRLSYAKIEERAGLPAGSIVAFKKNPESLKVANLQSLWSAATELAS